MLDSNALAGKRILVTGGGTGLGKSMSERFLELGARVVVVSRRDEVLREVCEGWNARFGLGRADWMRCDVRDAAVVEHCVNEIWQSSPCDALVNNAAGNFLARSETLSPRAVDAVLAVVLQGTSYMTLACGKKWISAGKSAHILNIVTTYAQWGSPFVLPSAMAKAGVLALTRSLAVEWGGRGIRCNAIAPGLFPTSEAMARLVPREEDFRAFVARCPLGRTGRHEELANLAAFLISDAAPFINGECVTIDGGDALAGASQFGPLRNWSGEDWEKLAEARRPR